MGVVPGRYRSPQICQAAFSARGTVKQPQDFKRLALAAQPVLSAGTHTRRAAVLALAFAHQLERASDQFIVHLEQPLAEADTGGHLVVQDDGWTRILFISR